MINTAPHFLLFTEAKKFDTPSATGGRWRFVLEKIGSDTRFEEAHLEPAIHGERLELLAVVRGLEALEQPSKITLFTSSRYVGRGIRRGLEQWRRNNWRWEKFGEMTPVKHADLWQRVDNCLSIHEVTCRIWTFDAPHQRAQSHDHHELSVDEVCGEMNVPDNASPQPATQTQGSRIIRFDNATVSSPNRPTRKKTAAPVGPTPNNPCLAHKIKPVGAGRAFGYAAE